MRTRQLTIRQVFDVPLLEISGLGQRPRSPEQGMQVLAVGDEDFTVVSASVESSTSLSDFRTHRLHDLLGGSDEFGSQWEAADGDSTGRVFILQESPGRVFILNSELDRLLHTIDLSVEDTERLDWKKSPNAQGEGLVLLANGHLVVAKEKEPPLLIEFGPEGEEASGIVSDLLLLERRRFPEPAEASSKQVALTVWDLDGEADTRIDDISDVAVGPDERLYLLSDESRCIARVEHQLPAAQRKLSITAVWKLPEEIVQPEGLVLMDDMTPLVAIDRKERNQNLFLLDPLEG
ncbi:MAG: SdiA-regulated domain-containing protein [Actinomycetota bacterium]